jgi:hypothetical protein
VWSGTRTSHHILAYRSVEVVSHTGLDI